MKREADPEIHAAEGELVVWVFIFYFFSHLVGVLGGKG